MNVLQVFLDSTMSGVLLCVVNLKTFVLIIEGICFYNVYRYLREQAQLHQIWMSRREPRFFHHLLRFCLIMNFLIPDLNNRACNLASLYLLEQYDVILARGAI